MTDWSAFVGLTGVVLVLLLALARLSQGTVDDIDTGSASESDQHTNQSHDSFSELDRDTVETETPANGTSTETERSPVSASTSILLANVALSQGLFGIILVAGAWYTGIPSSALGITGDPSSVGLPALAIGCVAGLALYVSSAVGAASAAALGYDYEERLRDLLTPETVGGWVLLLGGVLPIIAGFEELLFRAALIGVPSAGFDISPWFLAGGSSAAFAFGHGAQGRLGILVTGVLGFALAAVFIHTNSLLAVVVAHYLVNALEFVISGALGIEWAKVIQSDIG